MARAIWLADALRGFGVTVVEHDGWTIRGSTDFAPRGIVVHHTAGPARGDAPSLRLCIEGRPDLPGPLCQIVLARSGKAHVIAAGKANHAGRGGWEGLTGNRSVFGIEAENTGRGEPWPAVQLEAYHRCCAAICDYLKINPRMVCAHREWAPSRKIDPAGISMPPFRQAVAALLTEPPEDDMFSDDDRKLLKKVATLLEKLDSDVDDNLPDQVGEIRRNLRKTAKAAGVPADEIES